MSSERKDGVAGVDRMWDSQWVNVVNAPEVLEALRDYRADEAVNIAVKLTEQAMAKNARQLAEQRAELLEALKKCEYALRRYTIKSGSDEDARHRSEGISLAQTAIANATQQRNAQE